jgi:hypothetical protein
MAIEGYIRLVAPGSKKPYASTLRRDTLIDLGMYESVQQAEVPIENAVGKHLHWELETHQDGTQVYVGTS